MLLQEVQADRYDKLKVIPVLDNIKLSEEQKEAFASVDLGKEAIFKMNYYQNVFPEMPAELVPLIEEIWTEEVVGK